jgi:transporter family-2 protein
MSATIAVKKDGVMNSFIVLVSIAAVGGIAVTLQGQFMGLMDRGLGTRESIFITYAGGGLIVSIAMLLCRGGNLKAIGGVPWYAMSAGILGLVIVGTIGYTVPRMGLSKAFTIIVAAQFIMAVLLDHFGWLGATVRPIELTRLMGMGTLILGVWLIIK